MILISSSLKLYLLGVKLFPLTRIYVFMVGIVKLMASFPALVHSQITNYCEYISYATSLSTLELEHAFDKGYGAESNQQEWVMCVESACARLKMCALPCINITLQHVKRIAIVTGVIRANFNTLGGHWQFLAPSARLSHVSNTSAWCWPVPC